MPEINGNELAPVPFPPLPTGRLLARFELDAFLSLNKILEATIVNPYAATRLVKRERQRGRKLVIDWAKANGVPVTSKLVILPGRGVRGEYVERLQNPLTSAPIFFFARYWRKKSIADPAKASNRGDAFNPALKPLVDGFTDAGLWADDNEEVAPNIWISYAGLLTKAKAEIFLYEYTDAET
jgi:hypothetical protein